MSDLSSWIQQEREKANSFLIENGFKYNIFKNIYYKKIKFQDDFIELRVWLVDGYPIEYPIFFVDQDSWYLKYPHIDIAGSKWGYYICHIDSQDKVAVLDGEALIEEELKKIYEIIRNYEKGNYSIDDFLQEFDTYWGNWSKPLFLDLCHTIDEPILLDLLTISPKSQSNFRDKKIITPDEETTKSNFEHLSIEFSRKEKILYIPLGKSFKYPFANTKNDFLKIIDKSGHREFFDSNIQKTEYRMMFSFLMKDIVHFAAVKFAKPFHQPLLEILEPLSIQEKIQVNRIDRKRIFSRGGNAQTASIAEKPIKVAIVGCGSLGGSLAFKLVKSGIKNLILIDPDKLKVENIGRHICGMKYVNMSKTGALEKFLKDQFPDLNIRSITKSGENSLEELSDANLIVVATGSDGDIFTQLLLQSKHSKNRKINVPVILTWFEGSIGGTVILIDKTDINDFTELAKKTDIVEDSHKAKLLEQDMGCNSSFSPYAFIDAEFTVLQAANIIAKYISLNGVMEEGVWTILNDTAVHKGILRDKYKNVHPYSVQYQKLKNFHD